MKYKGGDSSYFDVASEHTFDGALVRWPSVPVVNPSTGYQEDFDKCLYDTEGSSGDQSTRVDKRGRTGVLNRSFRLHCGGALRRVIPHAVRDTLGSALESDQKLKIARPPDLSFT